MSDQFAAGLAMGVLIGMGIFLALARIFMERKP